ncbi:hypothetical protein [Nocardioides sp. B-3]|uniref:hypothetical protein n=1 Tax=Nocardioides sp. B-3 TaxID=2895565 RepID=UPI00300E4F0B
MDSREELVSWELHLKALGVEYTPIRDMEFGAHLNFRDPDHIALELSTSNETVTGWFDELREHELTRDEIDSRLADYLVSTQVSHEERP